MLVLARKLAAKSGKPGARRHNGRRLSYHILIFFLIIQAKLACCKSFHPSSRGSSDKSFLSIEYVWKWRVNARYYSIDGVRLQDPRKLVFILVIDTQQLDIRKAIEHGVALTTD